MVLYGRHQPEAADSAQTGGATGSDGAPHYAGDLDAQAAAVLAHQKGSDAAYSYAHTVASLAGCE